VQVAQELVESMRASELVGGRFEIEQHAGPGGMG
jgi:hypothetical protein